MSDSTKLFFTLIKINASISKNKLSILKIESSKFKLLLSPFLTMITTNLPIMIPK